MALDANEMALEQPESESAGSVPGNAAHPPSHVRGFLEVGDLMLVVASSVQKFKQSGR